MTHPPHPLPPALLREVDDIVLSIRTRQPRRLDVDALADSLDVQLSRRHLGDTLLGLTLDDRRVVLHSGLRGASLALVFAHELAHVLRRRGYFQCVSSRDEEWFADSFARELVLPRHWVTSRWPRTQLGALHIDIETVALQMAAIGAAPALMRSDRRVLCRICGIDPHIWDCSCRAWRRGDRDLRKLPDVRDLHLLFTPPRWRDAWLTIDDVVAMSDLECLDLSQAAIDAHREEDTPGEPITDPALLDAMLATSPIG